MHACMYIRVYCYLYIYAYTYMWECFSLELGQICPVDSLDIPCVDVLKVAAPGINVLLGNASTNEGITKDVKLV